MPVVLGKIESASKALTADNIPFEQSIEIQKLRPGSGHLQILNKLDGPIKCIEIRDVKCSFEDITILPDPFWKHASVFNKKFITENSTQICEYMVSFLV